MVLSPVATAMSSNSRSKDAFKVMQNARGTKPKKKLRDLLPSFSTKMSTEISVSKDDDIVNMSFSSDDGDFLTGNRRRSSVVQSDGEDTKESFGLETEQESKGEKENIAELVPISKGEKKRAAVKERVPNETNVDTSESFTQEDDSLKEMSLNLKGDDKNKSSDDEEDSLMEGLEHEPLKSSSPKKESKKSKSKLRIKLGAQKENADEDIEPIISPSPQKDEGKKKKLKLKLSVSKNDDLKSKSGEKKEPDVSPVVKPLGITKYFAKIGSVDKGVENADGKGKEKQSDNSQVLSSDDFEDIVPPTTKQKKSGKVGTDKGVDTSNKKQAKHSAKKSEIKAKADDLMEKSKSKAEKEEKIESQEIAAACKDVKVTEVKQKSNKGKKKTKKSKPKTPEDSKADKSDEIDATLDSPQNDKKGASKTKKLPKSKEAGVKAFFTKLKSPSQETTVESKNNIKSYFSKVPVKGTSGEIDVSKSKKELDNKEDLDSKGETSANKTKNVVGGRKDPDVEQDNSDNGIKAGDGKEKDTDDKRESSEEKIEAADDGEKNFDKKGESSDDNIEAADEENNFDDKGESSDGKTEAADDGKEDSDNKEESSDEKTEAGNDVERDLHNKEESSKDKIEGADVEEKDSDNKEESDDRETSVDMVCNVDKESVSEAENTIEEANIKEKLKITDSKKEVLGEKVNISDAKEENCDKAKDDVKFGTVVKSRKSKQSVLQFGQKSITSSPTDDLADLEVSCSVKKKSLVKSNPKSKKNAKVLACKGFSDDISEEVSEKSRETKSKVESNKKEEGGVDQKEGNETKERKKKSNSDSEVFSDDSGSDSEFELYIEENEYERNKRQKTTKKKSSLKSESGKVTRSNVQRTLKEPEVDKQALEKSEKKCENSALNNTNKSRDSVIETEEMSTRSHQVVKYKLSEEDADKVETGGTKSLSDKSKSKRQATLQFGEKGFSICKDVDEKKEDVKSKRKPPDEVSDDDFTPDSNSQKVKRSKKLKKTSKVTEKVDKGTSKKGVDEEPLKTEVSTRRSTRLSYTPAVDYKKMHNPFEDDEASQDASGKLKIKHKEGQRPSDPELGGAENPRSKRKRSEGTETRKRAKGQTMGKKKSPVSDELVGVEDEDMQKKVCISEEVIEDAPEKTLRSRKNQTGSSQEDEDFEAETKMTRRSQRLSTQKKANYTTPENDTSDETERMSNSRRKNRKCRDDDFYEPEEGPKGKRKRRKSESSDDDLTVIETSVQPKKKLAPIFCKNVPPPVKRTESCQAFLMSGVPEELKKQVSSTQELEALLEAPLFPTVSHIQQKGEDWDQCEPSKPLPTMKDLETVMPTISTFSFFKEKLTPAKPDPVSFLAPISPFTTSLLRVLVKEVKFHNEAFPANRTLKAMIRRREDALKLAQREAQAYANAHVIKVPSDDETIPSKKNKKPGKKKKKRQKVSEEEKKISAAIANDVSIPYCLSDVQAPRESAEIIGNTVAVKKLKNWLQEWKNREQNTEKEKHSDSDSDSDFDVNCGDDGDQSLCNTILLKGPVSSGKTSTVYALAQELGFKVFEVNASELRTGKRLHHQLQEATQSHQVGKANTGLGALQMKEKKTGKKKSKDVKAAPSQPESNSKTSLIFLEDIDIVFDDQDEGMLGAVATMMSTTKRPIILTTSCEDPSFEARLRGRYEVMHFSRMDSATAGSLLQCLCLVEGARVSFDLLEQWTAKNNGDMRRCIQELQFWLLSGGGRRLQEPLAQKEADNEEGDDTDEVSDAPDVHTGGWMSLAGIEMGNIQTLIDTEDIEMLVKFDTERLKFIHSNWFYLLGFPLTEITREKVNLYPLITTDTPKFDATVFSTDDDDDDLGVKQPAKGAPTPKKDQNEPDVPKPDTSINTMTHKMQNKSVKILSDLMDTFAYVDGFSGFCSCSARNNHERNWWGRSPTAGLSNALSENPVEDVCKCTRHKAIEECVNMVALKTAKDRTCEVLKECKDGGADPQNIGLDLIVEPRKDSHFAITSLRKQDLRMISSAQIDGESLAGLVPLHNQLSRREVVCEDLSYIRAVCRYEQHRQAGSSYRKGRFRHYLSLQGLDVPQPTVCNAFT